MSVSYKDMHFTISPHNGTYASFSWDLDFQSLGTASKKRERDLKIWGLTLFIFLSFLLPLTDLIRIQSLQFQTSAYRTSLEKVVQKYIVQK